MEDTPRRIALERVTAKIGGVNTVVAEAGEVISRGYEDYVPEDKSVPAGGGDLSAVTADAEKKAKKTIADAKKKAKASAEEIIAEARAEAAKIIGDAQAAAGGGEGDPPGGEGDDAGSQQGGE